MAAIPREILEVPLQPLADSPTERYYTDWRVYTERLGLPASKRLDPVEPRVPEGYCLVDASRPSYAHDCPGLEAREYRPGKPSLMERMAHYHHYRAPTGLELVLRDGARVVLLFRGGDAYTGYTLRVATDPGARAEVILVDTALQEGLKTVRLDMAPGEGSELAVTHLSLHGTDAAVYLYGEAHIPRGARLLLRAGGRPGAMTRSRLDVYLDGEEAAIDAVQGYAANARRQGDIILNVTHRAPRSVSRVEARGIARDASRLVMRGIARVLPKARGSRTNVEVHVIVAGDNAKGRSIPMLEIYTGDVEEASHSASAAMLLEDVLFYMETRGLSRDEALLLMERGVLEMSGAAEAADRLGLLGLYLG